MSPDTILIIEDDPDDLFLLIRRMGDAHLYNPIEVATDGEAGLKVLSRCVEEFKKAGTLVLPLLVLLDLKLPNANGFEVLEKIRGTPELDQLVTVVLTGSGQESDILMAYQLGARTYIMKPPLAVDLYSMVRAIESKPSPDWLKPGKLPGIKPPRP